VLSHLLDESAHTHLAAGNVYNRIDEIEVRKLTVRAVVDYVYRLKTLLLRIVDRDSALKGSRLKRQRGHEIGIVGVMVCIYPSLCPCLTIGRDN
jgi:hypothetical protein